jgi:hypothetical protein
MKLFNLKFIKNNILNLLKNKIKFYDNLNSSIKEYNLFVIELSLNITKLITFVKNIFLVIYDNINQFKTIICNYLNMIKIEYFNFKSIFAILIYYIISEILYTLKLYFALKNKTNFAKFADFCQNLSLICILNLVLN